MSQVPYAELQRIVDRFLDEARKIPGVQNLQIDLRLNTPEVRVSINRDKLADIGVNVDTVGRTLRDDARRPPGHALQARGRAVRRDRAGRAARPHDAGGHQRHLRARHATASMVQLANLVDVQGRRRAAVAQPLQPAARGQDHRHARARLHDRRRAEGDGRRREARAAADRADRPRRPVARVPRVRAARSTSRSCWRCSSSTSCCRRSSRASSHPFVIMLSVPLSMTGALLALWLTGGTLNIYSQVGLDHAGRPDHQARHPDRRVLATSCARKGEALIDAVVDAATLRLRPILMTTGAMVLGALPLALARRRGRRVAHADRLGDRRRHVVRHAAHAVRRAGRLHARRAQGAHRGARDRVRSPRCRAATPQPGARRLTAPVSASA